MLEIPVEPRSWRGCVAQEGEYEDLNHVGVLRPASKFEYRHFLSLRVIWKSLPAGRFEANKWGIHGEAQARERLQGLKSWLEYLDLFEKYMFARDAVNQMSVPETLGAFANVFQFQRQIIEGPENPASDSVKVTFSPISNRTRSKDPVTPTRSAVARF